jgi:hypothetical protein
MSNASQIERAIGLNPSNPVVNRTVLQAITKLIYPDNAWFGDFRCPAQHIEPPPLKESVSLVKLFASKNGHIVALDSANQLWWLNIRHEPLSWQLVCTEGISQPISSVVFDDLIYSLTPDDALLFVIDQSNTLWLCEMKRYSVEPSRLADDIVQIAALGRDKAITIGSNGELILRQFKDASKCKRPKIMVRGRYSYNAIIRCWEFGFDTASEIIYNEGVVDATILSGTKIVFLTQNGNIFEKVSNSAPRPIFNTSQLSQPGRGKIVHLNKQPVMCPKGYWRPDSKFCEQCNQSFTMFLRRHHCRQCGGIFCDNCSKSRRSFCDFNVDNPKNSIERVCNNCHSKNVP